MSATLVVGAVLFLAVALKFVGVAMLPWLKAPSASGREADAAIQEAIEEANSRLAQTRAGLGVANLPMILVVGEEGTAKTSTILDSGLDATLLAGQVYQDKGVSPTRVANIFYARATVLVEAGGALMADPQSWKALARKLAPSRLKAMGSRGQAPRAVLLCVDLEPFSRSDATDGIAQAAATWQARLGEMGEILGIRFPVYILFTRADRLSSFAEFVRNLNLEEAGQAVGATFPMRTAWASGISSETETRRLARAFDQLVHSFCDHRLPLLARESDGMTLAQAYEFPVEFRKLCHSLTPFLAEVCRRPIPLETGPFLRGFYFSGVRPTAPLDAQRLFVGELFTDVLLADGNARAASGSSAGTSLGKRIVLQAAAAAMVLYSGLLIWSYFGNRELEREPLAASRGIVAEEGAGGAIPGIDSLEKLETLRQSLARLTAYERDGAPLRLRWGLYKGSEILPDVRKIYYAKFRQLLFGATQAQMVGFPQRTPTDWKRSPHEGVEAFLPAELVGRWAGSNEGEIGKDRLALARKQFEFYASDLHNGNPDAAMADVDAGNRAAAYSSRPGIERAGQSFCSAFNEATLHKFPFDPRAKEDAKLDELGALLQPKSGRLWVYYDSSLKSVLRCSHGECSGADATLQPGFAEFIGNLMKFSLAIYGDAGREMHYRYALTPLKSDMVEEFDVTMNGARTKLKGGAEHTYEWPGSGTRNFELDLKLAGGGLPQRAIEYDGPWSVFRFFAAAENTAGDVFRWRVASGIHGRPLAYDFRVGTDGPVLFRREFLSTLKCVVPVAQ